MITGTFPPTAILIALALIVLYFLCMAIVYRKQLAALLSAYNARAGAFSTTDHQAPPSLMTAHHDLLPPLMDRPEAAYPYEEDEEDVADPTLEDDPIFEMMDEEQNLLLLEAEKVVEKIQLVVDNIASHPVNPEEVTSKVRAIVSRYPLFIPTEYFEAINNFIAVTVERDCELTLTKDQVTELWQPNAAN